MNEVTHYLCVGCPLGCRLEVEEDEVGQILEVRGFSCRRGKTFAVQEHTDPRRMVATTVRVTNGTSPRLPVRTRNPVPKAQVLELCHTLHALELRAPITIGEVVLKDALGSNVDVIASRSIAARSPNTAAKVLST